MYAWSDLSSFEIGVTVLLLALGISALAIYGKISYLVRLKEIELRKTGILEKEE